MNTLVSGNLVSGVLPGLLPNRAESVLETGKVINISGKTVCSNEKHFALLRFLTGLYPFLFLTTLIWYPKGTFPLLCN